MDALSDRVKYWMTFNEPQMFAGIDGMRIKDSLPKEEGMEISCLYFQRQNGHKYRSHWIFMVSMFIMPKSHFPRRNLVMMNMLIRAVREPQWTGM